MTTQNRWIEHSDICHEKEGSCVLLRILDVDGRLVDDGREVLDLGVALLQRVLLLLLLLVAATELILLRALRDLTGIYFHSSFSRYTVLFQ